MGLISRGRLFLTQKMMKNKAFFGVLKGTVAAAVAVFAVFGPFGALPVFAAGPGAVVINEVAWAGSADSANDEWIELFNTTGVAVDLSGWTIIDDNGASVYALGGTIAPYGYFVIEDSAAAVNPESAGMIVNLSLANTGDSLVLYDGATQAIDAVNSTGGMWFAGSSATYSSMERINAAGSGDDAANWVNGSGAGSAATASLGSLIIGTPGMLNSASTAPVLGTNVLMNISDSTPDVGGQITVSVNVENAADLFSYGFEIMYNPAVLVYSSVSQGTFLNENGTVATSFQSGLEDGIAGKLLVAEARTIDPESGIDGSGTLFVMTFDVVGGGGAESAFLFGAESFMADLSGDTAAGFTGVSFTPAVSTVAPVTNLQTVEASQRYSIQLSWNPSADATLYRVYRMDAHGTYVLLGETAATLFVDGDAVADGGKIIPNHVYGYRVIAVRDGILSVTADVNGTETRGLKGDNNRSDRVDGKDLDNLARHFAEDDADAGFDALADTTYDGMIDGSDLIDLGINFALTYG